jgi:sterol desaturase/sphingolipid hydroxylase (fatty acid hydroxylase superfamily)
MTDALKLLKSNKNPSALRQAMALRTYYSRLRLAVGWTVCELFDAFGFDTGWVNADNVAVEVFVASIFGVALSVGLLAALLLFVIVAVLGIWVVCIAIMALPFCVPLWCLWRGLSWFIFMRSHESEHNIPGAPLEGYFERLPGEADFRTVYRCYPEIES